MALTKKVRFEVFKRDSFTCQYCGRGAPDVVLHVDHIQPKSKGGTDDLLNLVTSCIDCNQGKKARLLSDDAAISVRKKQLGLLQQRREQLEMLMQWHKSLLTIDDQAITGLCDYWSSLVVGYTINDTGTQFLRKWYKRFGFTEVIEAMQAAVSQYVEYAALPDGGQHATHASVNKAFDYIVRICACNQRVKEKPYLKELYYARGILRHRLSYVNEQEAMELMEEAVLNGVEPSEILKFCRSVRNWTAFRDGIKGEG
jgi:hypothetical protein